jgi:hypothetical protein
MRCSNIYCQHNLGNICDPKTIVTIDRHGSCEKYVSMYKCDGCGCELNYKNNHLATNYCDDCGNYKLK